MQSVVEGSGTMHLAPSRYQLAGTFHVNCRFCAVASDSVYSFAKRFPFRKVIVAYFALVPPGLLAEFYFALFNFRELFYVLRFFSRSIKLMHLYNR